MTPWNKCSIISENGGGLIRIKVISILKNKNRSIYWLAQKIGMSWKDLSKIVNNKTKGSKFITLDKIARALDVSIDDLFDREDHSLECSDK